MASTLEITATPAKPDVDEDDDFDEKEKKSFRLNCSKTFPLVIVATSKLTRAFCSSYLLKPSVEKLGDIMEETERKADSDEDDKSSPDPVVACEFMPVSDDCAVCVVKKGVDSDMANQLAAKILEVSTGKVVVLSSSSLTSLWSSSELNEEEAQTRHLTTAAWDDRVENKTCPKLERPNTVAGIAAAILTACEFSSRPCLLLTSFASASALDVASVERCYLRPLSSLQAFKSRVQHMPERQKAKAAMIKAGADGIFGNIYI